MGPVRGGGGVLKKTKRRRKNKNSNNKGGDSDKVDSNVTLLSAQPRQSFDWWDDFSKRITVSSWFNIERLFLFLRESIPDHLDKEATSPILEYKLPEY
ncbi:hypothetical protein CRG98_048370 [Punica granatum]|uniref:Uncharacterized protein n=1 Tax=Punica granatum TaxID=22663 RepID=A0A2I0HHN7_PUNGR|nr:hypothetical protein CRG98_048370 [Punica granatum]